MSEQMINDLGRKITGQLQELLEREIGIARHVLDDADVTMLMLRIAATVSSSALLVMIQVKKDEVDAAQLFDLGLDGLTSLIGEEKAKALAHLRVIEAARAAPSSTRRSDSA